MSDAVIVICTYNNADVLDRALAAVAAQTFDPSRWSAIVIDNNSTDRTAEVVGAHIRHARIPGLRRVIETRQGLAHARRRAVAETEAPLIAFIDDDCLLAADWLEQTVAFLSGHPRAGVVGGRVVLDWEVPPDPVIVAHSPSYAQQDYGDRAKLLVDKDQWLVGAGMVIRREAIAATTWAKRMALVGRKGRKLLSGDDTELTYRVRTAGYELWYCPRMRLDHFIQKHRISVDYLCRMQRGLGRAAPYLELYRRQVDEPLRLRHRFKRVRYWLGRLLPVWRRHVVGILRGRRDPALRVELHWLAGGFEGALRLVWSGYDP